MQIDFLTSPPINRSLTNEQKRILKILSRGSNLLYQELIRDTTERIELIIESYYARKPIIDDLNKNKIFITDFEDMKLSQFSEDHYKKTIPILISWLKKNNLSLDVKASIIDVLIQRPVSKSFALDTIMQEYKKNFKTVIEDGSITFLFGNALIRWIDDNYATMVFELLDHRESKRDNFLLASVVNFKNPDNIEKAREILLNELKQKDIDRDRLFTIIATLRRLKNKEAKKLIKILKPFTTHNDTEIRNEAKKAMAKFEK